MCPARGVPLPPPSHLIPAFTRAMMCPAGSYPPLGGSPRVANPLPGQSFTVRLANGAVAGNRASYHSFIGPGPRPPPCSYFVCLRRVLCAAIMKTTIPDTIRELHMGRNGSRNFSHKSEITTKQMVDQNIRSPTPNLHHLCFRRSGLDGTESQPSYQVLMEHYGENQHR